MSPAWTFLDSQKNASSLTSGAVVPLRFCLALKLCHFPCVWCSSEPFRSGRKSKRRKSAQRAAQLRRSSCSLEIVGAVPFSLASGALSISFMFDANLNQVFSEQKQEVMKPFWDPERSRKFFWKAKRIQPFVDSITSFAIYVSNLHCRGLFHIRIY